MVRMAFLSFMIVVLIGVLLPGCTEEDGLIAVFEPQLFSPHRNAISLQRGDRSDEYFNVVVQLGNRNRMERVKITGDDSDETTAAMGPGVITDEPVEQEPLQNLLVDVRHVSFTLEWLGSMFDFLLEWEPGDYFETLAPGAIVNYDISLPFIAENGLTQLRIDISIDPDDPNITLDELYTGDLLTLRFRGLRTAQVPLNFAGKWGDVYNSAGERISGISWYAGLTTILDE